MTSPSSPPRNLRERKRQRARDEIYTAALDLLAERPFDEVTIDEICERAEVGRASFFRIYGAKAGLLLEFNHRLARDAREAMAAQPSASAVERLRVVQRTLVTGWTATGPALREMLRAFLAEAGPALFSAAGDAPAHPELLSLVAEIVEEGQRAGELDTRLEPGFASWLVVTGMATATGRWVVGQNETGLEKATEDVLEVLLGGLARF
ncbi:TetR/AcrR family transcriptional regulator [Actinomadura rugatobispora]|uniref:TetR/AcrR family transcriptional regulator n=1 Tax=Actinomadura rugatobispora TaxID=1994 RepID=A0ABW0ZWB5_9ACTN|nr:TetR/AcrR family transcriptional regulator [Actinomadura rugatobispora]